MWPALYLPKGEPKYEKLDYWTADLRELLHELQNGQFSGTLEILSPHMHGLFLFHTGRLHNCFYDGTEELQLTHQQVVEYFLQKKRRGPETVIHVVSLAPGIIEALSALESRRPLYRELETGFLDMDKLFETLEAKHFTGFLRFYRIRSHTRLGNILIKMNKITREQLQEAVRLQLSNKNGMRLGDALVQSGAISAQDLDSALDLQSHARKGSDVEIALALFRDGYFLGGYSHMHKQFNRQKDEILPQLVDAEVLMDITEGGLPDPIDLQALLAQEAEKPAPAPEKSPRTPESAPQVPVPPRPRQPETPRPSLDLSSERVMILRNEELFLDLRDQPVPEAQPPAGAPLPPEAVPAPEAVMEAVLSLEPPAQDAPPADAPLPDGAVQAVEESKDDSEYWIPDELRGLEYAQAVVEKFMGPLGWKLLEREIKLMGGASREWTGEQLRELGARLEKSARLILGAQQAGKLREKINERTG